MSTSPEMARFFEFLSKNQEQQDKFRDVEDQNEALAIAVKVAQDNGFDLSAEDLRAWLDSEAGEEGKLSEGQLELVAGGAACWTKTGYSSCPCESGYCASGC